MSIQHSPQLTRDQHCYVTGGSSGLGLSVAKELAKRGAHVSIVARNQERLDQALKILEVRVNHTRCLADSLKQSRGVLGKPPLTFPDLRRVLVLD